MKATDDVMAADARALVRGAVKAALATSSARNAGAPNAALVTVACDMDGAPVLLLSTLSAHTRNLLADGRASLLYDGTGSRFNPQEGPRVTVAGHAAITDAPGCRARFLARHPGAALYADFGDFSFWRVAVDSLYYVGGFAQARPLPGKMLLRPAAEVAALAAAERGILEHMNEDHGDALDLMAAQLLGRRGSGWRMEGIDPDGCDLMRAGRRARLAFPAQVLSAGDARDALVVLTKAARQAASV